MLCRPDPQVHVQLYTKPTSLQAGEEAMALSAVRPTREKAVNHPCYLYV
jgi:hypothetical protein